MMLPTLVPTLNAYDDLIRPGLGTRAGWAGLVAGFLAVWVGMAAVFAAAQAALLAAGLLNDLGALVSRTLAGLVLAGAGLWQFTRSKQACHEACLSPMGHFLGRWRPGLGGGARMGASLGAACVGCCWAYMALGFVGGTMNLAWMGVATLLMIFEKLPEVGRFVVRPVGALMLVGGLWMGVT
jgi:predicted metal-binding membrane protein